MEQAKRAAAAVKPDSFAVSFCSQCKDATLEVWRVHRAVVTLSDVTDEAGGPLFELVVYGKRLFTSTQAFSPGNYKEPVAYRPFAAPPDAPDAATVFQSVDLAYFYVPTNEGERSAYAILGRSLNLPVNATVEAVSLPVEVTEAMARDYPVPQGE